MLTVVESHVGLSVVLFLLLFLTHQLKEREGGVGKRGREGGRCTISLHLTKLGIDRLTRVFGSLPGNWWLCIVLQSRTLRKPRSLVLLCVGARDHTQLHVY